MLLLLSYFLSFLSSLFAAVSVVLKERRSKDSVTLAWQGPERPNGAIVEYEVIYYEKVKDRDTHEQTHTKKTFFWFFLKKQPHLQRGLLNLEPS